MMFSSRILKIIFASVLVAILTFSGNVFARTPVDIQNLVNSLGNPDAEIQTQAVHKINKNFNEFVVYIETTDFFQVYPVLSSVFKNNKNDKTRLEIIDIIYRLVFISTGEKYQGKQPAIDFSGIDGFKDFLIYASHDASLDVKRRAIQTMQFGLPPSEDLEKILVERFVDEQSAELKTNTITVMAWHRYSSESAIDAYVNALNDPSFEVRAISAQTIAKLKIDHEIVLAQLAKALASEMEIFPKLELIKAIVSYGKYSQAYLPDIRNAVSSLEGDSIYEYAKSLLDKLEGERLHEGTNAENEMSKDNLTGESIPQNSSASVQNEEADRLVISESKRQTIKDNGLLTNNNQVWIIAIVILILIGAVVTLIKILKNRHRHP